MEGEVRSGRRFAIRAIGLPAGVFAIYFAYRIVPEVVRTVVPAVVRAVTTN